LIQRNTGIRMPYSTKYNPTQANCCKAKQAFQ